MVGGTENAQLCKRITEASNGLRVTQVKTHDTSKNPLFEDNDTRSVMTNRFRMLACLATSPFEI